MLPIVYEKRRNDFCSQSCGAKYHNLSQGHILAEDKIYKLVYDGLINSKEPMKMLDILKKKTPELWAKLEELGGEKMNIGAEMGDLGFS